eukprot:scaffold889_cov268-Pinguiococcus_pyrenoidosus.AAC.6
MMIVQHVRQIHHRTAVGVRQRPADAEPLDLLRSLGFHQGPAQSKDVTVGLASSIDSVRRSRNHHHTCTLDPVRPGPRWFLLCPPNLPTRSRRRPRPRQPCRREGSQRRGERVAPDPSLPLGIPRSHQKGPASPRASPLGDPSREPDRPRRIPGQNPMWSGLPGPLHPAPSLHLHSHRVIESSSHREKSLLRSDDRLDCLQLHIPPTLSSHQLSCIPNPCPSGPGPSSRAIALAAAWSMAFGCVLCRIPTSPQWARSCSAIRSRATRGVRPSQTAASPQVTSGGRPSHEKTDSTASDGSEDSFDGQASWPNALATRMR